MVLLDAVVVVVVVDVVVVEGYVNGITICGAGGVLTN